MSRTWFLLFVMLEPYNQHRPLMAEMFQEEFDGMEKRVSQNLPKLCQTMILNLSSPAFFKVEFACRRRLWMIPLDWKVGLRLTHWVPHTHRVRSITSYLPAADPPGAPLLLALSQEHTLF